MTNVQDVWSPYGLRSDPFEVLPTEKDGLVSLSTFQGRQKEAEQLKNVIVNSNRSLSVISGDPGVGKTSLANYVRDHLSQYYFSPTREIDCQENWTSIDFLYSTLYEIYDSINKSEQKDHLKEAIAQLEPLFRDFQEGYSAGAGIGIASIGINKTRGGFTNQNNYAFLKGKFESICKLILSKKYQGIILHYNNLENFVVEDDKKFKTFLLNIRDVFKTPGVHFVFVGNSIVEECFIAHEKVQSYLNERITLKPLELSAVFSILEARFQQLKKENISIVAPITQEGIEFVWKLHEGNIRDILNALKKAVIRIPRSTKKDIQLNAELIKQQLKDMAQEEANKLTPKAKEVLRFVVTEKQITNSDISTKLKIKPQNTSKYLTELRNNHFVKLINIEGRNRIFSPDYTARWLNIQLDENATQTKLNF